MVIFAGTGGIGETRKALHEACFYENFTQFLQVCKKQSSKKRKERKKKTAKFTDTSTCTVKTRIYVYERQHAISELDMDSHLFFFSLHSLNQHSSRSSFSSCVFLVVLQKEGKGV